mmetsp:Transcript_2348/g.4441  ORF Transcript_2348/g.4441 Transcript_2348/m.4441 type:complete len:100 (-) Transcript_2348:231-530(-)
MCCCSGMQVEKKRHHRLRQATNQQQPTPSCPCSPNNLPGDMAKHAVQIIPVAISLANALPRGFSPLKPGTTSATRSKKKSDYFGRDVKGSSQQHRLQQE